MVVDNKPGANGQLAAQAVSTSPADGHTFLVTDGSVLSINPRLYKSQNFDASKDFIPLSLLTRAPMFLAVQSSLGVNSLQELIGKRIASPEYQMTAPAWIRGILSDHYGVPVDAQPYL